MAILEQLMKKGQQKAQKTPKNEKTSKQLLGEFYGDKKHLESLLKDKGTVLLHLRPCDRRFSGRVRRRLPFVFPQIWRRVGREMGINWRWSSRTACETSTRAPSSGARRSRLARRRGRPRAGRWRMIGPLQFQLLNGISVCSRASRKSTRVRNAAGRTCCSACVCFFFLTACCKTYTHRSVIWKHRCLHQEGWRSRENGPGMLGEGHAQQEGASGETVQLYGECLVWARRRW